MADRTTRKSSLRIYSYITLLMLLFFSFGNLYIFIFRNDGYNDKYYDYCSIYYPDHIPAVTGFESKSRDKLKILISNVSSNKWKIINDNGQEYETGPYPVIQLMESNHTYIALPLQKQKNARVSFTFEIAYTPSENYLAAGHSSADSYQLTSSSIPIGNFKRFPITTFAPSASKYLQEDVEQAQIIINEIGIDLHDSTEITMEKIGEYILQNLDHMRGIPTDELLRLSPLKQFQLAAKGGSRIWCVNFAKIYAFFANVCNIPTRIVEVSGKQNHINLSEHTFCESFIKEKGCRAFVDLTSRKISVKNQEGKYLNVIDIFHVNRLKSFDSIVARYYSNNSFSTIPYISAEQNSEAVYFNENATFKFYRSQIASDTFLAKTSRYILDPAFCYSLKFDNTKNYVKKFFILGQILSFIGFSFICIFRIKHREIQ